MLGAPPALGRKRSPDTPSPRRSVNLPSPSPWTNSSSIALVGSGIGGPSMDGPVDVTGRKSSRIQTGKPVDVGESPTRLSGNVTEVGRATTEVGEVVRTREKTRFAGR